MKSPGFLSLLFFNFYSQAQFLQSPTPVKIYGDLFVAEQMQKIFADGKIFVAWFIKIPVN
jgi:hypothetical protein